MNWPNSSRRFLAAVFAFATSQLAPAQEQPAPTERHSLLAVLEAIDPLDTSKLPLVRVKTLAENSVASRIGWVIEQKDKQYRIRYLDLGRNTITVGRTLTVEAIRIPAAVAELRQRVQGLDDRESRLWFWTTPTNPMHPQTRALMLARACELRGMHDAKNELLQIVGNQRAAIARDLRLRVVMNMCDPQVSWQQLLQQRTLINKTFAMPRAGLHLGKSDVFAKVIADLSNPNTAQAKRLLIQDPWLDGNEMFDAMQMDSPAPKPSDATRPLSVWLQQGRAVAPDLIALLDDTTATRSLNWSTKYGGVVSYNTVGDQANAALELLTGASPRNSHLPNKRRAAWQAWLEQTHGADSRKLAESRLEYLKHAAVEHYLAQWPDGIDLVLHRIEQWPHKRPPTGAIIALLRDERFQKLPRVHKLAKHFIDKPMHEPWRVAMARYMFEAGIPEGLAALRTTWNKRDYATMTPPATNYLDEACSNVRMLMLAGNADDWQSIGAANQFDVVRHRCALVLLSEPDLLVQAGLREPKRAEVLAAAKKALRSMLLDTEQILEQRGIPTDTGPVQLHGVACADAAAIALSNLQPTTLSYVVRPARHERHQQLAGLLELVGR